MSELRVRREGDVLHLDGRLERAAVARAWRALQPLRAGARTVDLANVAVVDSAGLALLAELAAAGMRIDGTPPGLTELREAYRLDAALGFAR